MKQEVKELLNKTRLKTWSELEDWEKFLDKDRVKEHKKKKKRQKHEVLTDPSTFDFKSL